MNAPMNFRGAFNGFNREDVVHFIEYLNARHAAEVNQLQAELDLLRNRAASAPVDDHREELAAALAENEALKVQIVSLQARLTEAAAAAAVVPAVPSSTDRELEAYRRAERTERVARERAELVYHQVNGVLGDASVKVDEAYSRIDGLTQQVTAQLSQLQEAVTASRQALSDAAATLYTIRPTGEN